MLVLSLLKRWGREESEEEGTSVMLSERASTVDMMNKEAKSSQETATHDTEQAN